MTELSKVIPSLLSRDLAATARFYEGLGFCIAGGSAENGWIEVQRDAAVLQFYADPPIGTPDAPIMSGTIYFYVDSVDALAAEWSGRVAFVWGPETMDYGMREFAVRDPDGYLLAFAAPACNAPLPCQ